MPLLWSGVGTVVMIGIQMKSQSDLTGGPNTGVAFWVMSERIMPLALIKCHVPLALESVHSVAHPNSKVHTFTYLLHWGCLGSPLSIGGAVLPMLMSSVTENQPRAVCHTGSLKHSTSGIPHWYNGQSPPSLIVDSHSYIAAHHMWWQHRQSHVRWLVTWKMLYIFELLSVKEIDFHMTSDVGHQAAILCQLMEWWWLTTVHLPWAPHWVSEFWLSQVLPLLCRGEACALGSQQQWTDDSMVVSLILDEIFILHME